MYALAFFIVSSLAVKASALTASDVDFSNAYIDMGTVFGSFISIALLLLSARAVMNFLSR